MDHDFVCIGKQISQESHAFYIRGLESYIDGDWVFAQSSFFSAQEKLTPGTKDGPLEYMIKLLEKAKGVAPDDWDGIHAWDHDKKPIPPEVDWMKGDDDEESGTEDSDD